MAYSAAQEARSELATSICVRRFVTSPGADVQLAQLKDTSFWKRDEFIADGGWSKIRGLHKNISDVASACASELFALEELPSSVSDTAVAELGRDG